MSLEAQRYIVLNSEILLEVPMDILDLIKLWITNSKNFNRMKEHYLHDSSLVHYISEIIRYWNQIQFVTRKTLRAVPDIDPVLIPKEEILIYTTYRCIWEKVSFQNLWSEIGFNFKKQTKKVLSAYYSKLSSFDWNIALQDKSKTEIFSLKYAIPTFTIDRLLPVLDYSNIKKNIVAMDRKAREGIVFLQISDLNLSKETPQELALEMVKDYGRINIEMKVDDTFPTLLQAQVKDKSKILQSTQYKNRRIVIQDKASVASIYLLDPQPNELVCDLCAAPGMKSNLIFQLSNKEAEIIAGDIHQPRLEKMALLLKTYHNANTQLVQWDGIQPPIKMNKFDKVLLDAPCTGSGTFSSNPELKWKQSERFLRRNIFLQEKLLKSAIKLLKPGGTLIYSTCSLYPEEGEYQIKKIIDDQLVLSTTPSWLPPDYRINGALLKGMGRYLPAKHGTIGFFIAKLIKK